MSKHNLELLAEAAGLRKPLLQELVFVGASTTALLITDKAAEAICPTYDMDAIAEISSYGAYAAFSERLGRCGFAEDPHQGVPICWGRQKKTILGVMPLDEDANWHGMRLSALLPRSRPPCTASPVSTVPCRF